MTPKAKNTPVDVRAIQELLNGVPPEQGGPSPKLTVDGKCGPQTQKAIQQFQLKHFGWKLADGRVDPNGPALAKMNELSSGAGASLGDRNVLRCHPAPHVRAK
jgi:peptidoglycan hydrolase-like protein with peptidoglycan-binding domain